MSGLRARWNAASDDDRIAVGVVASISLGAVFIVLGTLIAAGLGVALIVLGTILAMLSVSLMRALRT